jgi:hypothetical protein
LIEIFVADGIIERNRSDHHPFFPTFDGIDHMMADQSLEHLIVLFEY